MLRTSQDRGRPNTRKQAQRAAQSAKEQAAKERAKDQESINSKNLNYGLPINNPTKMVGVRMNNEELTLRVGRRSPQHANKYIIVFKKDKYRAVFILGPMARWHKTWINQYDLWNCFEGLVKECREDDEARGEDGDEEEES